MTKVFALDLKVSATVYVKAKTKEQAIQALKDELPQNGWAEIADFESSAASFQSPELPEISISPAMTIHGPWGSYDDMQEV